MYSVKEESYAKVAEELLLLPQVVYERQTGRFYKKLESWWNRPTRLQQAAEELVYEDLSHGAMDLKSQKDVWEWLEQTARRTSILHQMLRRIQITASVSSSSAQHMAEFESALSAKLASEYFATLVKVLLHTSLQVESDSQLGGRSPFKDQLEEDFAIEQVLLVSAHQLCSKLKLARSGIIRNRILHCQQEITPDVRRAITLTNDSERRLYTLLCGFVKTRLRELEEDTNTDTDSESDNEIVESAVEKRYAVDSVLRLPTPPDNEDQSGQGTIEHEEESICPFSTLLHKMIGQIERGMLDVSRQADRVSGTARMMMEVIESLRKGLCSLRANDDTDSETKASPNDAQVFAANSTFEGKMENTGVWAAFNACLIEASLSVALYGRQERVKSGKLLRRDQCARAEQDSDGGSPNSRGIPPEASARSDKVISMTDVEDTYLELLDAALICAAVTRESFVIHDLLILIVGLWDRYVEYQTALWMSSPGPKMEIIDFIDRTDVAIGLRRLFKEVLLRHEMTAVDDLASAGLERSLVYRWETMLALAA